MGEELTEVPESMTLCFLSFNDHARLCSAAFEGLRVNNVREFDTSVSSNYINHVNIGMARCVDRQIKISSGEVLRVDAVPCSINWHQLLPQFYVVRDNEAAGAAFILKPKSQTTQEVRLASRLIEIGVLLENHGDLYASPKTSEVYQHH